MIPTEELRVSDVVIVTSERLEGAAIGKDGVEIMFHSDVATQQLAKACWNAARGKPIEKIRDGSQEWLLVFVAARNWWGLWNPAEDIKLILTRDDLIEIAEQLA